MRGHDLTSLSSCISNGSRCQEKVLKDHWKTIEEAKEKGNPLGFVVGDVVGTGSSRKSATNSVLWHMGDEIPCTYPIQKEGGFLCFGGKIASYLSLIL